MRSCLPIGAVLILTLAGCERPGQPGAKVEIQAALPDPGGAIPVPAAFPQEPDKAPAKPIAAPRLFRATGLDEAGRRFEGYLAVETAQEGYLRRGYFEWAADQGGGRYHFEGTYYPATRRVRWIAYCIEDRFKAPVMATYEATLSADARRFGNGTWRGGISVPGTWTAEVVGE